MKAIRIHGHADPEKLVYEDVPQPQPGPGEVLVRVYAAGVIALELTWDETYETRDGRKRALPIPGHDLSGVVEEVGSKVSDITVGSEVYALFPHHGASWRRLCYSVATHHLCSFMNYPVPYRSIIYTEKVQCLRTDLVLESVESLWLRPPGMVSRWRRAINVSS